MKSFITGICFLALLIPSSGFSQVDTLLKPGVVNFAVLVLDYETNVFEKGNLSYYSCENCDSILLFTELKPFDFGAILFYIDTFKQKVFEAELIWMDVGEIKYPDTFGTNYPFIQTENIANKPNKIAYYEWNGFPTNDSSFIIDADSVWNAVRLLAVTNMFAGQSYSAAIYPYRHFGGVNDKWIVFLYTNDVAASVKEKASLPGIKIFPNPAQDKLFVSQKSSQTLFSKYTITDLSGRALQSGELKTGESEIDVSILPKNLHLIRIEDTEGNFTVQKILFK